MTWLAGFGEEATAAVPAASGTLSHYQESRNGWWCCLSWCLYCRLGGVVGVTDLISIVVPVVV